MIRTIDGALGSIMKNLENTMGELITRGTIEIVKITKQLRSDESYKFLWNEKLTKSLIIIIMIIIMIIMEATN